MGVVGRYFPLETLLSETTGLSSSAYTSIPEVTWSDSHTSLVLGGNWAGGSGTAGLLQEAAVSLLCC